MWENLVDIPVIIILIVLLPFLARLDDSPVIGSSPLSMLLQPVYELLMLPSDYAAVLVIIENPDGAALWAWGLSINGYCVGGGFAAAVATMAQLWTEHAQLADGGHDGRDHTGSRGGEIVQAPVKPEPPWGIRAAVGG